MSESNHLFVIQNTTGQHLDEVTATSFEQAADTYRVRHQIAGYARLRITDADLFFTPGATDYIRILHTP